MPAVVSFVERAKELRALAAAVRTVSQTYKKQSKLQTEFLNNGTPPSIVHLWMDNLFLELQALLALKATELNALSFTYPLEVRVAPESVHYRAVWADSVDSITVNTHTGIDAAFDDGGGADHLFEAGDVVEILQSAYLLSADRLTAVAVTQVALGAILLENNSVPAAIAGQAENNLTIRLIQR